MWNKRIDIPKPIEKLIMRLFVMFIVYAACYGPVVRYTYNRNSRKLDRWAEVLYYPILKNKSPAINGVLNEYEKLWINND